MAQSGVQGAILEAMTGGAWNACVTVRLADTASAEEMGPVLGSHKELGKDAGFADSSCDYCADTLLGVPRQYDSLVCNTLLAQRIVLLQAGFSQKADACGLQEFQHGGP